MMPPLPTSYEAIGPVYGTYRRTDPRIYGEIVDALGESKTVLNVGAGAGSYEPRDRAVVAAEPSLAMIRARPAAAAPALRAWASELPFRDRAFDATMAVLTVHHWAQRGTGLREMVRVSRGRTVILTWDPAHEGFWLVRDYFPDILDRDRRIFPTMDEFREAFGAISIRAVGVPHDCTDGFLGAYWRRPERYLEPGARSAISSFSRVAHVLERMDALRGDLDSGDWRRRNADLMERDELDIGYRLIVAGGV